MPNENRYLLCLHSARFIPRASAQGGPPMITDDPGTPGNGKWENNLAVAFEHRPNERSFDSPAIDLNYGVGRSHPAHAARRTGRC